MAQPSSWRPGRCGDLRRVLTSRRNCSATATGRAPEEARVFTVAVALLIACGGAETPEPTPAPAPVAPATPETPTLTPEELKGSAENHTLVPSPVETQNALKAAGIETKLGSLIPERQFDLKQSDLDHIAIRTGVILSDMLLTVTTSEKPVLVDRLKSIRTGLASINGGPDIDAQLLNTIDRVTADAVTRDELLKEFDELSGAVIPELEFNGNARVVPLIQAGSWLGGANLVAKAVKEKGNPEGASSLLKQPAVVKYFLKYVKTEGAEKAPAQVTQKLDESLTTLDGLASKAEPFVAADIDKVIQVTDDVLALL